jgi:hypothetical protein
VSVSTGQAILEPLEIGLYVGEPSTLHLPLDVDLVAPNAPIHTQTAQSNATHVQTQTYTRMPIENRLQYVRKALVCLVVTFFFGFCFFSPSGRKYLISICVKNRQKKFQQRSKYFNHLSSAFSSVSFSTSFCNDHRFRARKRQRIRGKTNYRSIIPALCELIKRNRTCSRSCRNSSLVADYATNKQDIRIDKSTTVSILWLMLRSCVRVRRRVSSSPRAASPAHRRERR